MFERGYGFEETRLQRVIRVLSKSARLGQFFGVEVRLYWLALILIPYMFHTLGGFSSPLGVGTVVGMTLALSVSFFLIIYSHEMGHIAAGWRYGIHTPLITVGPMGGLAHMSAPAPRPSADVVVSLAGPAVHLVWLLILAPFYFFSDSIFPARFWVVPWLVTSLCYTNVALMVFNLLPCYPMDGGRVLQAALSMRMHPNRALVITAKVGIVGGVIFLIGGLFVADFYGVILMCIGISNIMACRQALVSARHQLSPYGGGALEPWEQDADAWKQGGGSTSAPASTPKPKGQGWLAGWRKQKPEPPEEDLSAEVDRLLVKIKHVGMAGLSAAEKELLERASRQARKKKAR